MEGCSARNMVPVSVIAKGVSSSGIASIFLVVRGGGGASNSVMMWVDQNLMNTFALVYTLLTLDICEFHILAPKGLG